MATFTLQHRENLRISHLGQAAWNKGKVHSEDTREKIRIARAKQAPAFLGKKHSEEAKIKMRRAKEMNPTRYWLGRSSPLEGVPKSEVTRKRISSSTIGKPHPNIRGEKHYNWKGGVTSTNQKIRASLEYTIWRRAVFERDNYTCVLCKAHGVTLNADHIKPFALFPELRLAIDNGRTLCVSCHRNTDTWGYQKMK